MKKKMDVSDGSDEKLTASLLEEVFSFVDSQTDTGKVSCKSVTEKTTFLRNEFSSELDAVLGKKNNTKATKKSSVKREIIGKERSAIHEGGLDISDDEDCHHFENNQDQINTKAIASHTWWKQNSENRSHYYHDGTSKNGKKWSSKIKSIQEKLDHHIKILKSSEDGSKDLLVDPVFYMRIINPKVSTTTLKERMVHREAVPPYKLKQFLNRTDIKEVNWVTGGAVVGTFVKKSQKGNEYCAWSLTDLKGDIKFISVYLFGSAYKEFLKLSLGTVVGILNPSILYNKNSKVEATLSVDNADKIMIFGTSKDYGTCRSIKKNGEKCTGVVNKLACEYCTYHLKQAYDRACRRPELQADFCPRGLLDLKNKVLGKNEGGKLYIPPKINQSIGQKNDQNVERLRMKSSLESSDSSKIDRDRELLQRLNGEIKDKNERGKDLNRSLGSDRSEKQHTSRSSNVRTANVESTISDTPLYKLESEKMINLDSPVKYNQMMRAKANAIKFIRQNGPLKKPSYHERTKRTPEQVLAVKRRIEAEEENEKKRAKTDKDHEKDEKNLLQKKMERSGITEKFLKLMNSESHNNELLNEAEKEEREKYFGRLEVREKLEEKMSTTYKIECKAVRCMQCNYKSFSASELCKKEKHPLKVVNAIKRFWKCGDCSARTVSLELVPLHSCKVCGSSKWERTSMLPEKKAPPLPNEVLSIRGHEEKFVGSVVRNPNINLLVPEEGP